MLIDIALLLAVGTALIGLVNLAGFFLSITNLYTWARGVAMALPTAIALICVGTAVGLMAAVCRGNYCAHCLEDRL